ncbi:hypothetical protein ASPWEDRAFT_42561 [Aspergillus wentii DTO 134E9]|uniref:Cytochrome P450 n=1 Tax=Aspergillus wentii DTO 134E9 TaxID=1073089 RepID=A0A1L9RI25_ASPWE|nr:uncharacterized protein ASPWEDRAFT_42561 [Aspergillus wentii DTO 134E9]OJJ34579.1 hypothetical protein ASPWEDRAFT_42561 [Aspergillus wentii DTO 134E9]
MGLLVDLTDNTYFVQGAAVTLALLLITAFYHDILDEFSYRQFPLAGKEPWEFTNTKARTRWATKAEDIIVAGLEKGMKVFQVMTGICAMLILDPSLAEEVKNDERLSFVGNVKQVFFSNLHGFNGFGVIQDDDIFVDVVKGKLTQGLNQRIVPLSKVAEVTLDEIIPRKKEWTPFHFAQHSTAMVARLSSYVFLGERISHNKQWLNIAVNYTIHVHAAVQVLRFWPSLLRPLALRFHPACRTAQNDLKVGRQIISKELADRENDPNYGKGKKWEDSLDWFAEVAAGRPYDRAVTQIGLSLVSTHTTGQLWVNTVFDLAAYPEYFQPLRDEIKAVVEADGRLKHASLPKLKLMDSFIKESQRLNPGEIASMHRVATQPIKLSTGITIPQGANVMVSSHWRKSPEYYEHPESFDGFRFARMRERPGEENRHQATTTSAEHLGFGHGLHVCPGRFMAVNEIKILLIHMLLKYDWKYAEKRDRPESIPMGPDLLLDKSVKLLFRAREPELDLSMLY